MLTELLSRHARPGRIEWIGLRSARRSGVEEVDAAELEETGLAGDHGRAGKRAVTLIQAEHLRVIAALAGRETVAPRELRRNLVVSGINLVALRHATLAVGEAEIELTVPCAPCSRMEEALGHGGYNAVRGHGGWCARVSRRGRISLGDRVAVVRQAAPGHEGQS